MEDEEIAAEDEEDMGVIETYSNYMPSKLKVSFKLYKYKMRSVVLKSFVYRTLYGDFNFLLTTSIVDWKTAP